MDSNLEPKSSVLEFNIRQYGARNNTLVALIQNKLENMQHTTLLRITVINNITEAIVVKNEVFNHQVNNIQIIEGLVALEKNEKELSLMI